MKTESNQDKTTQKDPVCNMAVSQESEYQTHFAGKQYFFCSSHCLQKFQEDPKRYANKAP